ncbi:MAG: hypothetical protein LBQ68_05695, partial [Clostridiales bacterium]|nr:hypothetical protein [Clostridiales bacterium]
MAEEIYVELSYLGQLSNKLELLKKKAVAIDSDFSRASRGLDWEVKRQGQLNSYISNIENGIKSVDSDLEQHKMFIDTAVMQYEKNENEFIADLARIKSDLFEKKSRSGGGSVSVLPVTGAGFVTGATSVADWFNRDSGNNSGYGAAIASGAVIGTEGRSGNDSDQNAVDTAAAANKNGFEKDKELRQFIMDYINGQSGA